MERIKSEGGMTHGQDRTRMMTIQREEEGTKEREKTLAQNSPETGCCGLRKEGKHVPTHPKVAVWFHKRINKMPETIPS